MRPNPSFWLIALLALLGGCATSTSTAPPGNGTAAGSGAPGVSLAAEHRRLTQLFKDTPVVVELQRDGNLRTEVPLSYAFDRGRAVVKPPLAAVLERLAPSAKSPGMKTRVTPPVEPGAGGTLARERAASARDYLVGKGVPPAQFVGFGAPKPDAIEILIGRL